MVTTSRGIAWALIVTSSARNWWPTPQRPGSRPLFRQLSADLKYLQDIPHCWPQMTQLKLPRFQYTLREVVSGATFVGCTYECSKSCSVVLAELLSRHLTHYGIDTASLIWQTNNGSEFLEHAQG